MKKQEEIKDQVGNEIKSVLALNGVKLVNISDEVNRIEETDHSSANLRSKLSRGTISYAEVKQIAEIIGYELVWQKKID